MDELEKKIADIEIEMGKTDFYTSPSADATLKTYQTAKDDLDKAMEEWESVQMDLGELEIG